MEEKDKFALKVISMEFSTEKPIVKGHTREPWVIWGQDNTYPQTLLNMFNNKSITHKQIINRKVQMIAGGGIEMPSNPSDAFKIFMENKNGDMSIDKLAIKMAYDFVIFNGFSLNPHWNFDGTGLSRLCYSPFERFRQDKYNSTDRSNGLPNYLWMSDNWLKCKREDIAERKVIFEQDEYGDNKWMTEPSQIFYYIDTDQGIKWYPEVEYSPAVNYIDAEWEIGNYHNSAIKNGFHAGFILNFATGIPTEEEMEKAYEDIRLKFTGTNNSNKFLLGWSNGGDGAPTLIPIPTNTSDTKYVELDTLITNKILQTHQAVNPNLFGVPTPGALGSRAELLEALAIYQSTYIDIKQKVLEDELNRFAKLSGVDIIKEPIKLKKYIIDIPDVSGTPVLTVGDIITLLNAIKSGQLDANAALLMLTEVYEFDEIKAKKLLQIPSPLTPINTSDIIPVKISEK